MAYFKLYFIFLFLVITGLCIAQTGGWVKQESGTNAQLNKIFFVDTETGWVVGNEIILGTTDGGETWIVQDTSDVFFRSVSFTDQNHGWAVGFLSEFSDGVIYHTADGGLHWQVQDSIGEDLHDIYFADADTGYICGGVSESLILKTTDGGTTWEINLDYSYETLSAIYFSDLLNGWAVGKQGLVMITENSGKLWNRHLPNLDVGYSYIYDVQFVNQDTGWCLGANYLFKSNNGGDNWELKSDPNFLLYTALHFYNADIGWLLAGYQNYFSTDRILHTSDGGASWQIQDSVQTDDMASIFFIDDKSGWVAGLNGLILKTTNGGITSIGEYSNQISKFDLYQNYPNPFNPKTIINYELPITNEVELSVYNLVGQKVVTLVNKTQPAGTHHVEWDAAEFSSGVYYYIIKAGEFQDVKKMILIK